MSRLTPYLARIRSLPTVHSVNLERTPPEFDGIVRVLRAKKLRAKWAAEVKERLSTEAARDLAPRLNALRPRGTRLLICTQFVGPELDEFFDQRDIDFVDLAGNVRMRADDGLFVHITGRRPERRPSTSREIRGAGFQALFALLVDPGLARRSVRDLASAAGVSKSAAAALLDRLRGEGWIVGEGRDRQLLRPAGLISRWVEGWAAIVRPRLLIGTYRVGHPDPEEIEAKVFEALGPEGDWAFGGGAAARRITGYYRGVDTVVHIARRIPSDFAKRLDAVPARDGTLILLRAPSTFGLQGPEHTAHPLLVYAELLAHRDERASEAADQIRERFL